MEGWFSIDRALLSHELWLREPFTRGQAWVDMIGLANHADCFIRVRGVIKPIRRGQMGWSQAKLADRWQWSRTKIRAFFDELEKEQQIKQHHDDATCWLTVLNYDMYQLGGQQKKQQEDRQKTAEKDSAGKLVSPNVHGDDVTDDSHEKDRQKTAEKDTNNKKKEEVRTHRERPADEASAVAQAARAGVPAEFAIELFNQLEGRDWVDGAGQPITNFMRHAKYRWNHRLSQLNEQKFKHGNNQQTRKQGPDRNKDTANEGKAGQYKRSV